MNPLDGYVPATKKARVEIIPLIDVIFFLLATFVLFTLSLQKIRTIDVPLPVAPPGPIADIDTTLYIQTSETGALYWKVGANTPAEMITLSELRPRLENYKRGTNRPRVMVRSDRHAKFGDGVRVFDEVRLAGIKEISVETFASPTGS